MEEEAGMLRKCVLLGIALAMVFRLPGCDHEPGKEQRPNMIAELRESFGISYEEASDEQLERFLNDEDNLLFAGAMVRQIRHGQKIERFLSGGSLTDLQDVEKECLGYLAKKLVMGALEATGIPFLRVATPLIGVLSTISKGVQVYYKFANVLQEFDKRFVMDEYIRLREKGNNPQEVFKEVYEVFEPPVNKIILLSKGLSELKGMEVTERDKEDFATYLEFCYQSWKLANDPERKKAVKDYILGKIAMPTSTPSPSPTATPRPRPTHTPTLAPTSLSTPTATPRSGLPSEGPAIEWSQTFGGANDDEGWSVQQTSDGGYIIVGYTGSYGAGGSDVWLIKTDAHGNQVWDRTFGSADAEEGCSVRQTSDGGYIIVGYTYEDVLLIKTDANGNKVWDRTFGEPAYGEKGSSVQQTSDGGYIIVGMTHHGCGEEGNPDALLIKTDAEGNQIWSRTFGDVGWDEGCWVEQTSDSGYIITGEIWSFPHDGHEGYDVWLIKTDARGNKVWERTFGQPSRNETAGFVQQTSDGGYIIGGGTEKFAEDNSDVWLIKTDATGTRVWDRTFGGAGYDVGVSVQQTSDGGYIIGGFILGTDKGDIWLIKTDAAGNKIWDRTFGDAGLDVGASVQQTWDGGYILVGFTESYGAGGCDVWLIKVGS
jgi:hypothetical protein